MPRDGVGTAAWRGGVEQRRLGAPVWLKRRSPWPSSIGSDVPASSAPAAESSPTRMADGRPGKHGFAPVQSPPAGYQDSGLRRVQADRSLTEP
eukprot:scaffold13320_cov118-Isochrysis_galbana.AAC.13